MDKLQMQSKNLVDENIEFIAKRFPNCVTEALNEEGKLTKLVDFDMLKQELSREIVEDNDERYVLNWAGKKQSILTANAPIAKTLRPCREESVDFDNTKNLYIEGDNLDVLKLLRETYLGKVQMIYIDPPYNTGNDFVYSDDFATSTEDYLKASKSYDDQGNQLFQNNDSNGRFHSDWLSMMYARLKLARDLLTNDGFIFISIDDNELFNLKKICDEIFGEDNFINNISIKMSELSGVKMKHLSKYAKLKESGLIYAKNNIELALNIEKKNKNKETLDGYLKYYSSIIENPDDKCEKWNIISLKEYFDKYNISLSDKDLYEWKLNNADKLVYRTNSRTVEAYLKNNPNAPAISKILNNDGNEVVKWDDKEMLFLNKYIKEYIGDIWMDISTINLNKETESVTFENGQKPLALLKRVIKTCIHNDALILDFFSGSASTAHAIMQQNLEDGGKRNFIMVQLPEKCNEKSEAYKAGYKNICEIGKERIRRVGKKIKEEIEKSSLIFGKNAKKPLEPTVETKQALQMAYEKIDDPNNGFEKLADKKIPDIGFRCLKLDSSCMKDIYYSPNKTTQDLLSQFEDNIKEDRTPKDLLFQVMLDMGVMLSTKITKEVICDKEIFVVDDDPEFGEPNLVCCFDKNLTEAVVTEIAKLKPRYIVFRDASMSTDSVAVNFDQIFETYSPTTTRKII